MKCPSCFQDNIESQNFCGQCGAPLPPAAGAASRAAPASYTPAHLTQRILTLRSALEGERKLVSVLFCDITRSTELATRIGADAMHTLLNRFFELALTEVHRFEGTINQFLGDGFMALFGAPLAHEDHARRALLAALAIQQRLRELGEAALLQLRLRMGVNTGMVVVGKIGDNLRMDYTAVGDTTHLAARLQSGALPDTIRVSPATQRAAAAWFEFKPLGQQALKGIADPLEVYELVKARAASEVSAPGQADGIGSPLVGRERELSVLSESLKQLRHGHGGIVLITGEPGLGKSRLLAETRRSDTAQGIRWLEGRSLSFGRNLSYWPFIEILKQCFGIEEADSEAQAWRKLEEGCAELFAERAEEVVPYLGTVLALEMTPAHEQRVKYLDPQALGRQVFLCMRQLFERLSARQPLLVIMEDWHWVDHSSVALCEHLLPLVGSSALTFWFAARPDPGESMARIRTAAATGEPALPVKEIALTALAEAQSSLLLDNLVGTAALPAALSAQILHKTEGNPFFIEEIIRALIAEGALAKDPHSDAWRLTKPVEALALPDTVQGVIVARIDRLEEGVKGVLKLASVIGRSFFLRILEAISEAGNVLDRDLGQLQQAELIRRRQQLPEMEYIFKHALVQEAAYGSILAERRKAIHRSVAQAIEEMFAGRLDECTSMLAYHYARAEDWDKAQDYLFKAGDQAGRMAADAEALEHYRQAEAAYMKVAAKDLTPLERTNLDRKLGQAFYGVGNHDQAIEHFLRALSHVGLHYPRTRWGIRRRALKLLAAHLVRRLIRRFGRIARPSMDLAIAKEISIIGQRMGWLDYMTDQERMVLDILIELDAGERSGDPLARSRGYTSMCILLTMLGAHGFARQYLIEGIKIAETIDDPAAAGWAFFGLGWLDSNVGAWTDSLRALDRSALEYRRAGDVQGWGAATVFSIRFLCKQVDQSLKAKRASELIRLGQDVRDPLIACFGLIQLGNLALACGTLDQAAAHLSAARDLATKTSATANDVLAAGMLGKCYLLRGNLEIASEILTEATRTISLKGIRGFQSADAFNGAAALLLVLAGHLSGTPRRRKLREAERACRIALSCARNSAGWQPEALRLHGLLAWLLGDSALAQARWKQSIAAAEALGFNVEKALTLLEMGKRLGEAALVDEATAAFAQIGAKVYLAFGLHAQASLAMQSGSQTRSVLQRYDQAIAALDEAGAEYDLGVACRQRANLYQRLGQLDCALTDLTKAQRCFEAVGASPEQDEARAATLALSHEMPHV